jgi:hypothetical protein
VEAHSDQQVSTTDEDARSMMKPGGGSVVGYNVQTAVDEKHHLIAAHEVTNSTTDRQQLSHTAKQAKKVLKTKTLTVVADAGYYEGGAIADCYEAGIKALVPKTDTSGSKAKGRYSKADFRYDAKRNEYICPANKRLTWQDPMGLYALWLLVVSVSQKVHHGQRQASEALGEGGCPGAGGDRAKETSACNAPKKSTGGTSLQYDQAGDGIDTLPDEAITERKGRDESSCTGLQHETGDQCAWNGKNHEPAAAGVKKTTFFFAGPTI